MEISLSKLKVAKLWLFSALFLLVGLWLIVKQPQTRNAFFNSPVVRNLAAYGGALMGLLGLYVSTRKLLGSGPALVIDENGILDNTSVFSFGVIPWGDVSGIYEGSVRSPFAGSQTYVTIGIKNPEAYLAKETNLVKRKLAALNEKNYGSPVHIATNHLKINHAELLRVLHEAFDRYRHPPGL